jgi:hypothetical protein
VVPKGTLTATVCRLSLMTPMAAGTAKLKEMSALAELGAAATVKARLLLQGPEPRAFLARTFQARAWPVGSGVAPVQERFVMPLFLSSCVVPW